MPTIQNKTRKPLRVPLPGGKTLHLGPGKTGQITAKAVEHPRLQALVEADEIEILSGEGAQGSDSSEGGRKGRTSAPGRTGTGGTGGIRHVGDR